MKAPRFPPNPDAAPATHPAEGSPGDTRLLTDLASIQAAAIDLATQARREVLIFSRDLDPLLYNASAFLAAIRRLALEVPGLPVRALLGNVRKPVLEGHRLIGLAHRLPSRIALRRVGDEFVERLDAFLIVDQRAYCRRPLADRWEAMLAPRAPAEARRLRAEFEQMWGLSEEDLELRRLTL